MIHDARRCEYVLPSGERVTDIEWALLVEPEVRKLERRKAAPLVPYPVVYDADKAKQRKAEVDRINVRIVQGRHEATAALRQIKAGHFSVEGGRFRLRVPVAG